MSFTEIAAKTSDVAKSESKNGFDIDKRADVSQVGKDSTEKGFDIDKRASFDENHGVKSEPLETKTAPVESEMVHPDGGSYREVKEHSDGNLYEVHHMPADCISPLKMEDGPTIKMEKLDHHQTASWGCSNEAKLYREHQKELIDSGDFRGAVQMDIDDIKSKFPDKYDEGISQMLEYIDKLESEEKI